MSRSRISVAVLAGGRSSRMGRDKAWVELDGVALVRRVVDRLAHVSDDVFVVGGDGPVFESAGLRFVPDAPRASGPVAGVRAALAEARHPAVFVVGCDMPFASANVALLLADLLGDADVAVPMLDGRAEPLHAVWSSGAAIPARGGSLHALLGSLRTVYVEETAWLPLDPEASSVWSLNTPAELELASRRLGS